MRRLMGIASVWGALAVMLVVGIAAAASPLVSISDAGFDPTPVTIRAGDVVTWRNTSSAQHSVVADDGSFDSGLLALNDQFANVFASVGRYPYHDATNPDLRGVVIVKAAKPTPTPKGTPAPTPPSGTLPPEFNTPVPVPTAGPTPLPVATSTATASPTSSSSPTSTSAPGIPVPASTSLPLPLLGLGILAVVVAGFGAVIVMRRRPPDV